MPVLQDPIVSVDTAFFYKRGWKDNLQMCAHVIALGEGWGFTFQLCLLLVQSNSVEKGSCEH